MIDKTDSIEKTVLTDRNFNTDRCHVLRKIYQKFDRVCSVKRTSLYFKIIARPAIKYPYNIHKVPQLRLGLRLHLVPNRDPNSHHQLK